VQPGKEVILLFRTANLEGRLADSTSPVGDISLNDSSFYRETFINSSLIYDSGAARAYYLG
jgi:hypothetical protein